MPIPICKDKKLIEGSKQFFDKNKKINELFVSPDGQYFLKYNDTIYHCLSIGKQAESISRDMLEIKPESKGAKKTSKKS